jgi:hypothetical protein
MTRYIVTTASDSEYDVWKEGGYWKILFRKKEMFVSGLIVQGEGATVVRDKSVPFNEIKDISQFQARRIKIYEKPPEVQYVDSYLTLVLGKHTNYVTSYREKK